MMTSLLLLIFSTMTGCELMSDRKNCTGGWVHVPFNNTETKANCQMAYGNHTNCILTVITRKPMNENKNKTEKHCDEQKLGISGFTKSETVGKNFTFLCNYTQSEQSLTKFICKGDDPSACQTLANTNNTSKNERFSMNDNKTQTNISITVREVTANDSGTYWCGAESPNKQHSDMFFSKLFLTVVSATSSPTTVSSTTVSPSSGLLVEPITLTLVCLSVLLFPVVLILIYKQKNTGTGTAPQHNREDCSYERIQEKLRKTNSKNLENPSESAEYATVNFQGCFDTVRPSTTTCEYTTVKFGRYPTNSLSFSHPD
ncbi:uncharacterized protein LOC116323901 isoform X5 [Oreochromis aureus]|uniref:uncharacterized protein LOC116323901 isoform X5 n=1 Tax=Oreochromis aureus TaxID=47969 RepID=UPI001954A23B|nr:uncharacterized protein LOC116323901 isoform X5 [Oreochromis aureus]